MYVIQQGGLNDCVSIDFYSVNFVFTWNSGILLKVERGMAKINSLLLMNRKDSSWINPGTGGLVSSFLKYLPWAGGERKNISNSQFQIYVLI